MTLAVILLAAVGVSGNTLRDDRSGGLTRGLFPFNNTVDMANRSKALNNVDTVTDRHLLPVYMLQSRPRSLLALKSISGLRSLRGVFVDFFDPSDDHLDTLSFLHAEEAALVRGEPAVSQGALWLNMRHVFAAAETDHSHDQNTPVNIVAVLPGTDWATSRDQVLVVVSTWPRGHLDGEDRTVSSTGGLACVLETARVLMADTNYRPLHSVVFALLDEGEEADRSLVFDFLIPEILDRHHSSIQGVINMGSLLSSPSDGRVLQVTRYSLSDPLEERLAGFISQHLTSEGLTVRQNRASRTHHTHIRDFLPLLAVSSSSESWERGDVGELRETEISVLASVSTALVKTVQQATMSTGSLLSSGSESLLAASHSLSPSEAIRGTTLGKQTPAPNRGKWSLGKTVIDSSTYPTKTIIDSSMSPIRTFIDSSMSPTRTVIDSSMSPTRTVIDSSMSPTRTAIDSSMSPTRTAIDSSMSPTETVISAKSFLKKTVASMSLPALETVSSVQASPNNKVIIEKLVADIGGKMPEVKTGGETVPEKSGSLLMTVLTKLMSRQANIEDMLENIAAEIGRNKGTPTDRVQQKPIYFLLGWNSTNLQLIDKIISRQDREKTLTQNSPMIIKLTY